MKTLGICVGASTISVVEVSQGDTLRTHHVCSRAHEGNPKQALTEIASSLPFTHYDGLAVTGRKICESTNLSVVQEPEASEYAFEYVDGKKEHYDALVSCGGETFMAYALNKEGRISTAYSGSKCASGTGEFFLQQLRRMNMNVKEAVGLAQEGLPLPLSSRCSVFCKSDCTHALNRAEPKANVVAGLCEMMAHKVMELLHRVPKNNIMVVGGVSQNSVFIKFLAAQVRRLIVPKEATYFEALGAALWALRHPSKKPDPHRIFAEEKSSFSCLTRLRDAEKLVTFKELPFSTLHPDDECVVGVDVGSTTTKAVIIKLEDASIVASVYLRTLGQPVEAARACYQELMRQIPDCVSVVGLGVTGSGRQIAGLHALTQDIINEIIAHAQAAVYFDKDVDTIFEIGGQDAKYTYLVNGVACDYAMNEACSAGTGSFLEEACKETLGVAMEEISGLALQSNHCPNFNDQCSAFVSGDIKTAIHEGLKKKDIVAGLVYSVCMNYNNRVKGRRPVGKKIFMQGGVCYIRAVPLAMASLLGKPLVIPPHPGLMGAFGVALEVRSRIQQGTRQKQRFDLKSLSQRTVDYGKPFICQGGSEHCDRKCEIAVVRLENKAYPFGGACNRYYNLRMHLDIDTQERDLVVLRQKMLFEEFSQEDKEKSGRRSVGLNLSFLMHNLFPLYRTFFEQLGLKVIVPTQIRTEGLRQQGSAFCYPAAVAHGLFFDLLQKNPDYLFLPHVSEIPVKNAISTKPEHQSTCHILQAEPYYLKTAFNNSISPHTLLHPVLNFSQGYQKSKKEFLELARRLKKHKKEALAAYQQAYRAQDDFLLRIKQKGSQIVEGLRKNPDEIAVVLFGHYYNAFSQDINLNIPHKFASRGVTILPFDFLPYEYRPYQGPPEFFRENLTWATGQMIVRAASFVSNHPQLFAVYITNFSCGPDSFLVSYFRQIMQDKPSLTLEIDSHTADAGINTRIEAFLDIVQRYRYLKSLPHGAHKKSGLAFSPSRVVYRKGTPIVITSDYKELSLASSRVHLLIPSMGELGTELLAESFAHLGIRATGLGVSDHETLKYGRIHASCKECLPLLLCCGSLLKYLQHHRKKDEVVVYFMPTVGGNCRFSQYSVFLENLIHRNQIEDVAILSLTSENGYVGFGNRFNAMTFKAVIVSDVFDDIRNALKVMAQDEEYALHVFRGEWDKIRQCVCAARNGQLEKQLKNTVETLKKIPLKYPLAEAKFVSLLGEIFVRKDTFSRQPVVERLTRRQIIPKTASVLEWLYYVDYLVRKGIISSNFNLKKRTEFFIKNSFQHIFEKRIKTILAQSGLYVYDLVDIQSLIDYGRHLVHLELTGEPIIVIGAALQEILHSVCGVVCIGPFGCLPSRVGEAILSKEFNMETKRRLSRKEFKHTMHLSELPFLSIEVDGNPFPPVVEAKFEAFCLQVERVHRIMQHHK